MFFLLTPRSSKSRPILLHPQKFILDYEEFHLGTGVPRDADESTLGLQLPINLLQSMVASVGRERSLTLPDYPEFCEILTYSRILFLQSQHHGNVDGYEASVGASIEGEEEWKELL